MKMASVTEMKRNKVINQKIPREGTALRQLYDRFNRKKGRAIEIDYDKISCAKFHGNLNALKVFYGLDIRNVGLRKWSLVGEWFDTEYKDYVAERTTV